LKETWLFAMSAAVLSNMYYYIFVIICNVLHTLHSSIDEVLKSKLQLFLCHCVDFITFVTSVDVYSQGFYFRHTFNGQ